MKKVLLVLLLLCVPLFTVSAWRIMYAEQYYKLYHEHLHHYPDEDRKSVV